MPARKVKSTKSAITYVRLRPEEKEALQRAADEIDRLRAENEGLRHEASLKLTLSFADPDEDIQIEVHGTEQHIRRLGSRVSFWAKQEREVVEQARRIAELEAALYKTQCECGACLPSNNFYTCSRCEVLNL